LRFGPDDFRRKSIDGLGDDWPIGYEDVKPYYDKIDKMLGVFGSKENLPNDPDGFFLPPPKPRLHELYYIKGAKKTGVPVIPSRLSILTKRINKDRGVCYYCSQCSRSCSVYADFSAGSCLIFPAQKNGGQIDLYNNCMVREVNTGSDGLATGVTYINKEDRQEYRINAKVVVLAASACSSARILLNSKSAAHPSGLGNDSGIVGKYLHDSTGSARSGFVPALMDRKIYNEDGVGGMHVYSPWWLDNKKLDFARGYHIEVWGGMGMPSYGFSWNVSEMNKFTNGQLGGYGTKLKEDVRRYYGAFVGMAGRGECIAREDNYCELDPEKVDEFGIPVLRFNYTFSDHERLQAKHMNQTFEEIITNMGGNVLGETPGPEKNFGLNAPGEIIHEVGTTRMGNDPGRSVTNKWQQLHSTKNVFITDAGPLVSQADKNCTWTILALAWRASDHIISELNKRNI
jgi:choline dehydrogenase-like flavoprotein